LTSQAKRLNNARWIFPATFQFPRIRSPLLFSISPTP
jgi:hypothetical protein